MDAQPRPHDTERGGHVGQGVPHTATALSAGHARHLVLYSAALLGDKVQLCGHVPRLHLNKSVFNETMRETSGLTGDD